MASRKQFAVCVDNTDYSAALEVRRIYQVLPDPTAAARSYLRVIDESGEDYLYPNKMFLQVEVRPEGHPRLAKVLKLSDAKPRRRTKKGQTRRRAASRKTRRSGS